MDVIDYNQNKIIFKDNISRQTFIQNYQSNYMAQGNIRDLKL